MVFTRTSCAVRTTKSGILFSIPLFFLRRVCYNGASIMKKVHSAGSRPVTFVHFCHHTPQGDVGEPAKDFWTKRTVWDHTPQGDVGEPLPAAKRLLNHSDHHTPQGDVGFCDVDFKTQLTTIMITPRKGTQTTAPLYCTILCGEAGRLLFCEILGCSRFFPQFFQLREFPQLLY